MGLGGALRWVCVRERARGGVILAVLGWQASSSYKGVSSGRGRFMTSTLSGKHDGGMERQLSLSRISYASFESRSLSLSLQFHGSQSVALSLSSFPFIAIFLIILVFIIISVSFPHLFFLLSPLLSCSTATTQSIAGLLGNNCFLCLSSTALVIAINLRRAL